ncbi:PAS domain-containing protein [Cohnella rhizosphaerae]|uniref:PAS domain-containing protein n=1 Tax=Cohnella rhizosphaerae TaxID=1457232 RepID=A0A9X4L346_9BACL|nr:PAS domain-containing protein [Cohnella rhizosphaerae]MDG0812587.1 PAS domain-containing protein [Cohnella rhizosphaerae]
MRKGLTRCRACRSPCSARGEQWFNLSRHGIGIANAAGRWIAVNEAMASLLGYEENALLEMPVEALFASAGQPEAERRAASETGGSNVFGVTLKDSGGRPVRFDAAAATIPAETEGERLTIWQFYAAMDQNRTEDELEALRERQRIIGENIVDLYYICDCEGRILEASPNAHALLGYRQDELVGSDERILFDPADLQRYQSQCPRTHTIKEYRLRHKDGKSLWFEAGVKPLAGKSGNPFKLFVGREITARKKHESMSAEAERIAAIGSWEWETASGRFSHSANLARIYENASDRPPGEALTLSTLVAADDRQDFEAMTKEAANGGEISFETRLPMKNASFKYLHVRGDRRLFGSGGKRPGSSVPFRILPIASWWSLSCKKASNAIRRSKNTITTPSSPSTWKDASSMPIKSPRT